MAQPLQWHNLQHGGQHALPVLSQSASFKHSGSAFNETGNSSPVFAMLASPLQLGGACLVQLSDHGLIGRPWDLNVQIVAYSLAWGTGHAGDSGGFVLPAQPAQENHHACYFFGFAERPWLDS